MLSSDTVRSVFNSAEPYYREYNAYAAFDSTGGVRPALNLSAETLLIEFAD